MRDLTLYVASRVIIVVKSWNCIEVLRNNLTQSIHNSKHIKYTWLRINQNALRDVTMIAFVNYELGTRGENTRAAI